MRRPLLLSLSALVTLGLWASPGAGAPPREVTLLPAKYPAPDFPRPHEQTPEQPLEQQRRQPPGFPQEQTPQPQPASVEWINSVPLTLQGLRGKVVLIDFWEYTCINCIRTFAENKKWYERYHKYGFEIIGVHDPEFDIAYPPDNVATAVKRFGLPYPVVVDDHFIIWRSYHNNVWPNRFVIDTKGFVRFNRTGEGDDDEFELAIQQLLREARPGLKFPASYTLPPDENPFAPNCGVPTEEMYVGQWEDRGILANTEGYHPGKTVDYKLPSDVADGHAAVAGRWETDKNGMIYRGKPKGENPAALPDRLVMRYHARELYAVMNVARGRPSRLYIQQDGKDLNPKNKGVDVRIDAQGHSYLEVREPRMYYLVANPSFGQHAVTLIPTKPGITINSFTFGNNCQVDFPHL